jgi:hypothetical protein
VEKKKRKIKKKKEKKKKKKDVKRNLHVFVRRGEKKGEM